MIIHRHSDVARPYVFSINGNDRKHLLTNFPSQSQPMGLNCLQFKSIEYQCLESYKIKFVIVMLNQN